MKQIVAVLCAMLLTFSNPSAFAAVEMVGGTPLTQDEVVQLQADYLFSVDAQAAGHRGPGPMPLIIFLIIVAIIAVAAADSSCGGPHC